MRAIESSKFKISLMIDESRTRRIAHSEVTGVL
jgi:hypothetical protein